MTVRPCNLTAKTRRNNNVLFHWNESFFSLLQDSFVLGNNSRTGIASRTFANTLLLNMDNLKVTFSLGG